MTDTNWADVFQILWDFTFQVIGFMSTLWDFLTTRVTIGFNLELVDIPLVGGMVNWFIRFLNDFSVSFVPLYAFGGITIITLLTLYLIKTFIPVA